MKLHVDCPHVIKKLFEISLVDNNIMCSYIKLKAPHVRLLNNGIVQTLFYIPCYTI
jgi:hypothetical protein